MIEPGELDHLKELCNKATPGPWEWNLETYEESLYPVGKRHLPIISESNMGGVCVSADNAAFIAAACSALPRLIEEVESLHMALRTHEVLMPLVAKGLVICDDAGNWKASPAVIASVQDDPRVQKLLDITPDQIHPSYIKE